MKHDGTLTISTSLKTVTPEIQSLFAGGNFREGRPIIVVEVRDTGPGVKEDAIDKLFEPFYTTKPMGEGTGLGLFVIDNILDLHRGAITIRNHVPEGLSVKMAFRLPPQNGAAYEKENFGRRR